MEELRYAYFLTKAGLVCVVISDIKDVPKYKIGLVLRDEADDEYPHGIGLFSHSNILYLVGGRIRKISKDFESLVLMFDHNKFEKCPDYIPSLEKFPNSIKNLENIRTKFVPMVLPGAIPVGNKTYFISDPLLGSEDLFDQSYDLQHFDAHEQCFQQHPKPPFKGEGTSSGYGHFRIASYLYLFVGSSNDALHVFVFNTKSSEWKDCKAMANAFEKRNIPAPIHHRGDVGLSPYLIRSPRFPQIMVALSYGKPIAYLVNCHYRATPISEEGEFSPYNHRFLDESYISISDISTSEGLSHLANFGDGRFCVVYGAIGTAHLLMYVFHIDFETEFQIQLHCLKGRTSSKILSSQKFSLSVDLPGLPLVPYLRSDVCFLKTKKESETKKGSKTKKGKGMMIKHEEAHLNIK